MRKRFRQQRESSSKKVRESLVVQRSATPKVLELMAEIGVEPDRPLCIEFFFYAKELADAQALARALGSLGYKTNAPRISLNEKWCLNGWTPPLPSDTPSMVSWSEAMVRLSDRFGAVFDGWGTFPIQEEGFFDLLDPKDEAASTDRSERG